MEQFSPKYYSPSRAATTTTTTKFDKNYFPQHHPTFVSSNFNVPINTNNTQYRQKFMNTFSSPVQQQVHSVDMSNSNEKKNAVIGKHLACHSDELRNRMRYEFQKCFEGLRKYKQDSPELKGSYAAMGTNYEQYYSVPGMSMMNQISEYFPGHEYLNQEYFLSFNSHHENQFFPEQRPTTQFLPNDTIHQVNARKYNGLPYYHSVKSPNPSAEQQTFRSHNRYDTFGVHSVPMSTIEQLSSAWSPQKEYYTDDQILRQNLLNSRKRPRLNIMSASKPAYPSSLLSNSNSNSNTSYSYPTTISDAKQSCSEGEDASTCTPRDAIISWKDVQATPTIRPQKILKRESSHSSQNDYDDSKNCNSSPKSKRKRQKSSTYRGVYFNRSSNAWRSRIWVHGKSEHLGNFSNEEDAARAFDKRAIELRGQFAKINFPLSDYVGELEAHRTNTSEKDVCKEINKHQE